MEIQDQDQPCFFSGKEFEPDVEIKLSKEEIWQFKLTFKISELIRDFMNERGLSLTDLSKMTTIPISTLSDWTYGKVDEFGNRKFQSSIRLDWRIFVLCHFMACDLRALCYAIGDIPEEISKGLQIFLDKLEIEFLRKFAKSKAKFANEKEYEQLKKFGLVKDTAAA